MMKKIILFAAIGCLAMTTGLAQNALYSWDKGNLTWDCFKKVDTTIGEEHSYLEFLLDMEEHSYNEYASVAVDYIACAYMDTTLSWVSKKHCTQQELKYNQVLFNIVELCRRRMQEDFDTTGTVNLDYYMQLASHEVDRYCRDTRYGADTAAIRQWDITVRNRMDSIAPLVVAKHEKPHPVVTNPFLPRAWEKGPLTWKNFTVVGEGFGEEHSYLEYYLDIENRTHDVNGINWGVKTAVALMDKNLSWVDRNHLTDQELRYNQVLFNLAELYRRYLQVDIDTGGKGNTRYYMQLLSNEAENYCRSTRYGADTAAVEWWGNEVRQLMDSITPYMVEKHASALILPEFKTSYFFGTDFGGGAKIFCGDMHNLFAPSGGFYCDFEGGYRRHTFILGMYIGGGKCKPDTLYTVNKNNELYNSDDISTIDLHIDYGFTVLDSRKLRITPFVGYGMQGVFFSETGDGPSGGPTEGCWRAGVDVKYHLSSELSATKSTLEQYFASVDAKVFVSRDRFNSIVGSPKGYTINLSLGFSLMYKEGKAKQKIEK